MSVHYTGENIANAIMAVFCKFDLVEKILVLTTDNVLNNVSVDPKKE